MKFVDLLEKHRVPFRRHGEHHHVGDGWIGIDCPSCSPRSGRFRLGYNLHGGYLSCWTCGGQSLQRTLQAILGLPAGTIREQLQGVEREAQREETRSGGLILPRGRGPLTLAHRRYLEGRGYDVEELQKLWGIEGIGVAARLSWRVFIPIHHQGEIVSWTTRSISDDVSNRYVSAKPGEEAFPAKSLLYGEDHVRHAVIVTEGPFDVWAIGPGAVATLGTAFTPAQVLRLIKYPLRVVCLDNEPAAQRRARKLCEAIEVFPGDTWNVVLDAKDAGSANPREIAELRREFLS